eukprot:CAMPEP_0170989324 /NCGR_PEP_ID=MMETSP0736-20130129/7713_1 /TAXON_ID=186038 /ORGANISM="Fragilariopsis kerguelensis, Strain L26-C5" /LENGTH=36 /DNA_ID= /DNA_START= /DNA_END= /DNA_ORIENTATION=
MTFLMSGMNLLKSSTQNSNVENTVKAFAPAPAPAPA